MILILFEQEYLDHLLLVTKLAVNCYKTQQSVKVKLSLST